MEPASNFTHEWDEWKTYVASLYESKTVHTIPPQNAVEQWWIGVVQYYGDFYLVMAFYFFMNLCYLLGGIVFWICDYFHLLHKYKIQTDKYPTNQQYVQCILNLVQNYILIIFPLVYAAYPIFSFLNFTTALPLPSWTTWTWQMLFFMWAEDFSHYWLHRWLHLPFFYKTIHKLHHTFAAPFGLAASFAHPIEVLVLGFCTFCGPLVIQPHFFTFYCWVLFRQLEAVATHCGYDLPNPLDLIPFYGGTKPHDYHHKNFIYNYSSRFTYLDKLFGTYKEDPDQPSKLKSQ